jgi:hypothetical protein
LVEGKLIEYALERKVERVVRDHLLWRIAPPFATIAAVLGFVGWNLNDRVAKSVDAISANLTQVESLQRSVATQHESVSRAISSVDGQRTALEEKIQKLNDRAVSSFAASSEQILLLARTTGNQAANAAATASAAGDRVASEQKRLQELERALSNANKDAAELQRRLQHQAKQINSSIIEAFSILERNWSEVLELETRTGQKLRARFLVKTITSHSSGSPLVEILVDVNGKQRLVSFNATPSGNWRAWQPLDADSKDYDYKIDFIYYSGAKDVEDFASIQVRATKSFVDALQSSSAVQR